MTSVFSKQHWYFQSTSLMKFVVTESHPDRFGGARIISAPQLSKSAPFRGYQSD